MAVSDLVAHQADLGVATIMQRTYMQGEIAGSLAFMAPEVLGGKYDNKADIWSLGLVFLMILTNSKDVPVFHTSHCG